MNLLTIYQPTFLPWVGYFNKILNCDTFVFQDDVQFNRSSYHHRARLHSKSSGIYWITAPVKYSPQTEIIKNIKLHPSSTRRKMVKSIRQTYSKSQNLDPVFSILNKHLSKEYKFLIDLNIPLITEICELVNIKNTEFKMASELSEYMERTERIIELAKKTNSDTYLFGQGASSYVHRTSTLLEHGVGYVQQNIGKNYPIYEQCHSNEFIDNLSIIDMLFSIPLDQVKQEISNCWNVEKTFSR